MKLRTFIVPFAEIVGAEATELEFDAGDYVEIRPLFSLPVTQIRDLQERLGKTNEETAAVEVDQLVLDMLQAAILKWHLIGPDGPIPLPATLDDLNALPGTLRGALFGFVSSYRGKGPNPTTAG